MKWEQSLPTSAMTKRSSPLLREEITDIDLHSFGDASGKGIGAAVCVVVFQPVVSRESRFGRSQSEVSKTRFNHF